MAYGFTHQSPTAEENHEDNKGFKIAVFHNSIAGLTEVPPQFSSTFRNVQIQARTSPDTFWECRQIKNKPHINIVNQF